MNYVYDMLQELNNLREDYLYEMPKELARGIFWVIAETGDELVASNIFPIVKYCDIDGVVSDNSGFSSKDGLTYNHEQTWKELDKSITHNKPFNYYPRGRVEINNGKATIWMNGNILHLADDIKKIYGLNSLGNVRVREDGSAHYKCHFDN